jgi:predicted SAM-dependent methyltransferase
MNPTLKAIARKIPPINRLLIQRDDLIKQRDNLVLQVEEIRRALAVERPSALKNPLPLDRRAIIIQHLNLDGLGLEVGPSYNPLVPKSAGYRVESIDHADAAHLREKYRHLDVSPIEEVDYISDGGSIFETIGKPGRYDYIIASHVIEHVPDLFGFLNDCERLLKPNGRLALAVPDKRYCFDIFQPVSTTGHVLETHISGARRPRPGTLFDYVANFGKRGEYLAWLPEDTTEARLVNDLGQAKQTFDRARTSEEYIDAHVWRFVPSSFRLILSDLNALGETYLKEMSFTAPGGFEFFVTLSRNGAGCPIDRLSLAKQVLAEQAAVAAF